MADDSRIQVLSNVLYDSRTLGAADVKVMDLFQKPNNAAGQPTDYYTNIEQTPVLPVGEQARVDGVAFSPEPDVTTPNIVKFMKGVLRIIQSKREQFAIPIKFVPSMGGVFGFSNQALATGGADYPSIGVPSNSNFLLLNPPIDIRGGETFAVQCEWPTAPGALFFHVLLRIVRVRPGA